MGVGVGREVGMGVGVICFTFSESLVPLQPVNEIIIRARNARANLLIKIYCIIKIKIFLIILTDENFSSFENF